MARLVVLGSNGFIGKHLTASLAQNKSNKIIAFDNFNEYRQKQVNPFSDFDNVELFPGDFLNTDDVSEAVKLADYVFHLISTTTPASSDKDPLIDLDTNVRASVELFSLCASSNVKRVIFPSSGGTVYGNNVSESNKEIDSTEPYSPYGIGKLAIENYLRYFKKSHGLDYIVYRLSNPYGPGQNLLGKQGVIPIFLNKILKNEDLTIFGDGEMVRDYIYIDDVINMITKTYDQKTNYSVYNIGSGVGESVNQIVDILRRVTEKNVSTSHVATPLSYVEKSVLNIERFTSEFNILPEVTLENGIKSTWEYIKKTYNL